VTPPDKTFEDLLARGPRPDTIDATARAGAAADAPGASGEHGSVRVALAGILWPAFGRPKRAGASWWILGGVDVLVPGDGAGGDGGHVIRADLAGVRRRRGEPCPTSQPVRERPDWICAITSSSEPAQVAASLAPWARARVPTCWIADLRRRTLTSHRWSASGYAPRLTLGPGASARLEPFEQIEIATDEVFGDGST
jgi:hypothetical protein